MKLIPWSSRKPRKPNEVQRWQERGRVYLRDDNGVLYNLTHERHDRHKLGLSARQFRKAKRLARLEERV